MSTKKEDRTTFQQRATEALAGHYYVHVAKKTEKPNKTGDGTITEFTFRDAKLQSWVKQMDKDAEFIYVPKFRFCGNRNLLKEYLLYIGCTETSINAEFANAYTVENCSDRIDEINSEIEEAKESKEEKKTFSLDDIIGMGKTAKVIKVQKVKAPKVEEEPGEMPPPSTPREKVKRTDLKSKLKALDSTKAFDISNFNFENRGGIKECSRAVRGERRFLAYTGELNKVVFDFSKDIMIAKRYLNCIGYHDDKAEKILQEAMNPAPFELGKVSLKK